MPKKRTTLRKKKAVKTVKKPAAKPRSFSGVIKGRSKEVRALAQALRDIVFEEVSDVQESFYGGPNPMGMYRSEADICWIQPLTSRCNVYFTRGPELTDEDGLLDGKSDRMRHLKVPSLEVVEELPIRAWLRETLELNQAELVSGISSDEALERLRKITLVLPDTKETITWGKPHFRVGEKIFCGCSEVSGKVIVGLKMDPGESELLMKAPGVEKAPYSRKGDGWIVIYPNEFDDWDEIAHLVVGSYRLIAPKRTVARMDAGELQ